MPIRPENMHRYPKDWKDIRAEILEREQNACKFCGLPNYAWVIRWPGEGRTYLLRADHDKSVTYDKAVELAARYLKITLADGIDEDGPDWRLTRIVLTIAHLDHQPENNGTVGNRPNLAALCQLCHNRYDRKHRAETRGKTRDAKQGQRRLF